MRDQATSGDTGERDNAAPGTVMDKLGTGQAAATQAEDGFWILRAGGAAVALEAEAGARPVLLYCGPDIAGAQAKDLALLGTGQHVPGGPSAPQRGSLTNEFGIGSAGPSGLAAHRAGRDWAIDLRVTGVERDGDNALIIACLDANTAIAANHRIALDPATGMLSARTTIANRGAEALDIEWCTSLCLPVDPRLTQIKGFTGRWAGEFQTEDFATFRGSYVRENKAGRTSHDSFPGLILANPATCEEAGLAAGYHLAWSGNHRLRVDSHATGRTVVQMGELPFPGEMRLAPGEEYHSPEMLACWSKDGIGAISDCFHAYFASHVLPKRGQSKARPVHYNTWEAVYFDHDITVLQDLAEKAAAVGAERFVLDDGWFGGRRNDATGLGDWWVSPDVYPDGLHPLVDKVRALGMEFGLWFEPEMVNPDSELYRAHPDWVLHADKVESVPFRGQLTLDLTRGEVFDYLFGKIDALVSEYAIDYIKWDMNRDTSHPGSNGRSVMHHQTLAVYRLLAKLRAAHPSLEIESCSSGGARADYGIMRHADRIWPSDNNDARERQAIQRGASYFLPLRVLGTHVGPGECHITGRRFSMAYRVGTAIFGHMGMELDLREESAPDRSVLAAGIALYKKHRALLHAGRFVRLHAPSHTNLVGVIAHDESEALFSYALTDTQPQSTPEPIFLRGLDPDRRYRVRLVWPQANPSVSTPSIVDAADLMGEGSVLPGAALMNCGMQPPLTHPDTCLIYHLEAE